MTSRLKDRRLALGMKQKDVALILGVRPSDLSKMERGIVPVNQLDRWLLAIIYHCKPIELSDKHIPIVIRKTRIGDWFKETLVRVNMTAEEWSVASGVEIYTIRKLLAGISTPDKDIRRILLATLFPEQLTK